MPRRDALLDSAFETLLDQGLGFPAEEVARRAEASKALLFHHFGSRDGLLDAMAARVLHQTQDGLASLERDHPNPRERLAALARTLLEEPSGVSPAAARRVLLFWLADDKAGSCRGALRDALVADFVDATIQEGVTLGAVRPGADARAVSTTLLARWHGTTALFATGREVDFEAEAERLVADVARLVEP